MTSIEQFVVALLGELLPWITLWVLAKYFLLAGNQHCKTVDRLLARHDDLTAQVIAFKNPWAAEQFARFKSMSERAPEVPPEPKWPEDELEDEQELM